jgi:biotin synthase
MILQTSSTAPAGTGSIWHQWVDGILAGQPIDASQAEAILAASDLDLLDLISAAYRLRYHYFGNTVQLYFLVNAKSGLCPEDCSYCSQSKISTAPIVISGRAPSEREMTAVETVVPKIKEQFDLKICACLGLLTPENAQRLKACGVDRVNHNLNTGEAHYSEICHTHTYQDRLNTLNNVRAAGLELCSGGIIGMGEQPADTVAMAMELRGLGVESIPLNFLHAIEGTPLQAKDELTPQRCLKTLCMFRFVNPSSELRIAGGREKHLRSLQPLGLFVANSVFVGDYLTTRGQSPEEDYQMIRDLGFEVTNSQ